MVDEVNDLIVPGAFANTLATRRVKAAWHHEWKDAVGVVLDVEEWLPGDRRFADIPNWPKEAGALVATVAYNRRTTKGRDTYEQVKQWHEHGEAAFSIGYRVPTDGATRRGDGVRVIHKLDLFEVSPVLHGAHPLTRALEVKSSTEHDGMEYKATPSSVEIDVVAPKIEDTIKVAGLAVKAEDTGRVLLIQRALDDDDPAAGMWEFPGGHLEDGEDALAAALREWEEETGSTLPGTTSIVGSWTAPTGIYRGYVAVIPGESHMPLNRPHDERRIANPDDPKGDATEVTAWWPITALPDMPLLRPECRETPWSLLAGATLPQGPPTKPAATPKEFADGVMARYRALGGAEEKSARAAVNAARARLPRIEHKSARSMVAEAKSRLTPLSEVSAMSPKPLPESQEQFRTRLADSVRELLDQGGDTWTCIEGTYPDHVIVSVHTEGPSPNSSSHYAIPYTVTGTGDITLDKPQPVELATIVVPEGTTAHRAATDAEDVDARVVQPTIGAITDATARVSSTTAGPEQLESVRDRVRELIQALSAKGLDATSDDSKPDRRPTPAANPLGMDLWDEDTFDDDEEDADPESVAEAEDTVRLDAEEVKSALALMQG
ncbi:NUDIX domain-containing protein [Streptomyces sp. NBC_00243]|uniref:NUDIX domain-containing protein n=1 Tax=Streptomyces sp. NBC_00243 TaxID=2975688 RepID=UPI002DDB6BAA|nr:NUDIX domain-containing protein [Streptomyces sp. NBC_00243]WRZ24317.1 NUDIX domain-containing protein [Streptomyces sp. NBC_00243]